VVSATTCASLPKLCGWLDLVIARIADNSTDHGNSLAAVLTDKTATVETRLPHGVTPKTMAAALSFFSKNCLETPEVPTRPMGITLALAMLVTVALEIRRYRRFTSATKIKPSLPLPVSFILHCCSALMSFTSILKRPSKLHPSDELTDRGRSDEASDDDDSSSANSGRESKGRSEFLESARNDIHRIMAAGANTGESQAEGRPSYLSALEMPPSQVDKKSSSTSKLGPGKSPALLPSRDRNKVDEVSNPFNYDPKYLLSMSTYSKTPYTKEETKVVNVLLETLQTPSVYWRKLDSKVELQYSLFELRRVPISLLKLTDVNSRVFKNTFAGGAVGIINAPVNHCAAFVWDINSKYRRKLNERSDLTRNVFEDTEKNDHKQVLILRKWTPPMVKVRTMCTDMVWKRLDDTRVCICGYPASLNAYDKYAGPDGIQSKLQARFNNVSSMR
jgi:hypothetical protein